MRNEEMQDKYIGTTIDGKYFVEKLIRTINEGYRKIYHIKDISTDKWCVMHVYNKTDSLYNEQSNYLRREIEKMRKFRHPLIVAVLDIIEGEEDIIVLVEHIEGVTLKQMITDFGAQPADKVVEWAKEICDLFQYLNSFTPSYIYRDIKPENVILMPNQQLKVMEMNIVTMHDFRKGRGDLISKGYAAPELYGGSGQLDIRTAIYALGMTIYYLVTGRNPAEPPYEVLPICQINPQLPKGLENIILKCIRKNPNERYQTCDELMNALQDALIEPPKKKGFWYKLFGDKKSKTEVNSEVKTIWDGMNKDYREKVFYGNILSADCILTSMTRDVFGNINDTNIDFCFNVYLQTWIRSHGGLVPICSTPTYIKQALCERFSNMDSNLVLKCVTLSLSEIYRREPELKIKAEAFEIVQKNLQENSQKNKSIESIYLNDPEYGLVSQKPIFVNGFGSDKEYLSHLYTEDGVKLSFIRVDSSKIDGIAGPVDLYRLLLPDNTEYLQIFICNYGSTTKKNAPRGTRYID